MTNTQVYAGAAVIGAVAGMRSMAAPALVSRIAKSGNLALENSKLSFLSSSNTLTATGVLALGEFVADKLPFVPARTKAGPLAGRAISGALSGAAMSAGKKKSPWRGALFGAAGAIGAAYGAYYLRKAVKENLNLPDPVVAVVEDAVVAGTCLLVVSQLRLAENA